MIAAALSLLLVAPAYAGDLDGAWRRDDKKLYVIVGDEGLELPLQEYASRFTIKRNEGALEWTLRFTRTADEANYFETTAKATGKVASGAKKLDMEFGYVEFDEKEEKITGRGTEKHTLVLEEKLTPEQAASIKKALAAHRKIDDLIEAKDLPGAFAAADAAKDEVGVEGRRRALAALVPAPKKDESQASVWDKKIGGLDLAAEKGDWVFYNVKIERPELVGFLALVNPSAQVRVKVKGKGADGVSLERDNDLLRGDSGSFVMKTSCWDPLALDNGMTPAALLQFCLQPLFGSDDLDGWPGEPFELADFKVVDETKTVGDKSYNCKKVSFTARDPQGERRIVNALEWKVVAWLSTEVRGTNLVAFEGTASVPKKKGLDGGKLVATGAEVTVQYCLDAYGRKN